jgi:hypothetical protein
MSAEKRRDASVPLTLGLEVESRQGPQPTYPKQRQNYQCIPSMDVVVDSGILQTPPDLVVKSQHIDIVAVIL